MMVRGRHRFNGALLVALALLTAPAVARAADHEDSPATLNDPTTDFGDVIAWMSPDAQELNLLASVVRRATATSRFSDAAQYVFHTQSSEQFGGDQAGEVNVICTFEGTDVQTISCWAGDESYVTGDASDPDGLVSDDGKLRVFAGLRNDAFFFNSAGFNETRRLVREAAPGLDFDAAGCPAVDQATSQALVTQLMSGAMGAPAADAFANANILVLAVAVDKSIVTPGGPIVAVWGSSNRR